MAKSAYLLFVLSCTVIFVTVKGDCQTCEQDALYVNLTSGEVTNLQEFGAEVTEGFTTGSNCDSRGVIKVKFDIPTICGGSGCDAGCKRLVLKVRMKLHGSLRVNYLFDIGDSSTGSGTGEAGDHYWDAQIAGHVNDVNVWSNDLCNSSLVDSFDDAIAPGVNWFEVSVGHKYAKLDDNAGSLDTTYCNNKCLFDLSKSWDPVAGAENDLFAYVAFNRVIGNFPSSNGQGICKAKLYWQCCDE